MSDHPTEAECRKVLPPLPVKGGWSKGYSRDDMEQFAIAAMMRLTRPTVDRNAVLEEAEKAVARALANSTAGYAAHTAVEAIRALKEPTND